VESIGSLMDSRLDDGQIKAEQIRVLRPLSQHIFLTLVESLEGGERLPTKILVTYLQHPEDSVRRLAIELLEYGNDPAAIPALLRAAADVNIEVSLSASEVLRSFRNPSVVRHLIEGLGHPAPETRLAAVVALRERRAPDAVKGLLRNISDVESEVRREAVITLAHYRNHDLLPALRSALRDESPAVRKVAVTAVALGESRNPAWIARLQPLLNDPDTGVQKSASRRTTSRSLSLWTTDTSARPQKN
jgi:HEAT repeat protein